MKTVRDRVCIRALMLIFIATASCLLMIAASASAHAADNRFLLASQQDWGAHRGFYVDLENSGPDGSPIKLKSLTLILSVADGANWRIRTTNPAWDYGHEYHVKAVISNVKSTLLLDGQEVGSSSGPIVGDAGDFDAGLIPDWAGAQAEYLIVQGPLTLTADGVETLRYINPLTAADMPRLLQAVEAPYKSSAWHLDSKQSLTVETSFTLVRRPADLTPFAPFVDRYGQSRYGDWPGKIGSDEQLRTSGRDEVARLKAMSNDGAASGIDAYGGDTRANWHENASGFYRVERKNGLWWLITPSGYPCFYTGISTAPAIAWDRTPVTGRESLFAELPPKTGDFTKAWGTNAWGEAGHTDYFAPHTVNMIRKYGPGWEETARELFLKRLRAWGFTGMGKWCDPLGETPYIAVLNRSGIPTLGGKPDIFDPKVRDLWRSSLENQMRDHVKEPYLVGWSIGNEHDEIITHDTVAADLRETRAVGAKKALVDYALEHTYGGDASKLADAWHVKAASVTELYSESLTAPPSDLETLRRFYADSYYGFLYSTVKSIDGNHLYFGFWIVPDWWENESDWSLIEAHCDAIGYDRYSFEFADSSHQRRLAATKKPVLCGEFSYPANYDGTRGFGLYGTWTRTDKEAGSRYARWISDAAENPNCIGGCWFQYRDEPVTGRGPGSGPDLVYGERFAFGTVDVTDQPKWDLVTQMRAANLAAVGIRLAVKANPEHVLK